MNLPSQPPPADTIAAVATPPGEGGIAIIRLSGPGSWSAVRRLCPLPSPAEPAHAYFRRLTAPDTAELLDEGIVLLFRAPHSYTGEDAAELQIHGSPVVARRILSVLLDLGVRQAEPGEFTRRAFLNDKLNLTQAEAVLDLIHARSEQAARMAAGQLANALGEQLADLYARLTALVADTEAMLDFPDDELPQTVPAELADRLRALLDDLRRLLATAPAGHRLRDGARIVLAGCPNVGKSTLLNRLAQRDRAIVSPTPGTTRDTIEETILFHGMPLTLVDTAGLRDAPSDLEQEGIRRARAEFARADLLLLLLDASVPLSADEQALLDEIPPDRTLILLNKTDLGNVKQGTPLPSPSVAVSLRFDSDLAPLESLLLDRLLPATAREAESPVAISLRHEQVLKTAEKALLAALSALSTGAEEDFLPSAMALREALDAIGQLLGRNTPEDVLDQMFSRFCIGK
jgi:tRNA modification GTPase